MTYANVILGEQESAIFMLDRAADAVHMRLQTIDSPAKKECV